MMEAVLIALAIGTIPTADILARLAGHNLRREGSGNPGAANALRVGGRVLGISVLTLDVAKGVAAVLVGRIIGGDAVGAAAGVAAALAQVLNPWYGFKGGKGLAVSAGAALVAWPPGLAIGLLNLGGVARLTRAAIGALVALPVFAALTFLWAASGLSTWWGIDPDDTLVWFALGIAAVTLPKFITELIDG